MCQGGGQGDRFGPKLTTGRGEQNRHVLCGLRIRPAAATKHRTPTTEELAGDPDRVDSEFGAGVDEYIEEVLTGGTLTVNQI